MDDEWNIRLKIIYYPQSSSYINFDLCNLNNNNKIIIKCSSYILNKDKLEALKNPEQHYLLTKNETEIHSLSLKQLMENRNDYVPDNTLTFCLDLTVYDETVSTSKKLALNIPKGQMSDDYTELYNTMMGSDVIVKVCLKEFRAHRSILMARSPVLAAMFSHDMVEKKENKISIPDIAPVVFEKLLKYIYTDEVTDLDAYAERLIQAADKYQIQSLKDRCQESLSKTLTVENVLSIMTLAKRHSAKPLLEFTNEFMASNIKKVIKTHNFRKFKLSNPSLACGLLEKFAFCEK
ncbi:speckle-type POZ protein B [Microplitis demolitor]|uniref:speckle-type POZ protein B n=1 Tax=Microplitis demolitor TaxID=69319 RepID=UPI00235B6435|nr:speckle-type POZ protein B [Microplitis demolitor]